MKASGLVFQIRWPLGKVQFIDRSKIFQILKLYFLRLEHLFVNILIQAFNSSHVAQVNGRSDNPECHREDCRTSFLHLCAPRSMCGRQRHRIEKQSRRKLNKIVKNRIKTSNDLRNVSSNQRSQAKCKVLREFCRTKMQVGRLVRQSPTGT